MGILLLLYILILPQRYAFFNTTADILVSKIKIFCFITYMELNLKKKSYLSSEKATISQHLHIAK
jgi:hypothetical protein